ncbi:MAG TPA: PrsW family intramembrane metalloprotease [Micromonosporaceae bacterium]|nr:PrsW family intramembrane metalloprotease [Micromonosporaceae bacterium]
MTAEPGPGVTEATTGASSAPIGRASVASTERPGTHDRRRPTTQTSPTAQTDRTAQTSVAVRVRGDRAPVGLVGKATTVPIRDPRGAVVPTPPGTSGRNSLRLPAFWLLVTLVAVGAWRVIAIASTAFAHFPVATATAAVLFVLYAVPFVIVARSVDFFEREPPLLVAAALAWGAVVATMTALSGNSAARSILAKLATPAFAVTWGPAIIAPTLEEILKTLGVVVVVLVARRQVNSVADGAVYGAFVGLGFQVVEDFVDACNAVAIAGRGDRVAPVIVTFLLRGFLGGLWSHTLFSALAGAGVAYYVVHRRNRSLRRRLVVALGAIAGAWLFHFVWNSPWFVTGFGFGGFGVLAGLIVKGAPALILVALFIGTASGHEADVYLGTLVALSDPRIITTREVAALRTGRRRIAARRYAYARCGRPGSVAVRQLQRAQAELALDLSRGGRDAYPLRLRVLVQRRQLAAMAHPEGCLPPGRRRDWGAIAVVAALALVIAIALTAAVQLVATR